MTDTLKSFAWETLKTTGAVFAVNMTPLPQFLNRSLPQNPVGVHLAKGSSYAVSKTLVDQLTNGASHISNMDYVGLLDDATFFSILSGVVDKSDLNLMAYNAVSTVSPLSQQMNVDIVDGLTISGGTLVANLLDLSTGNNWIFDFVRRPVSTSYRMLTGR